MNNDKLAVGYVRVSKLRRDKDGKKIVVDDSLGLKAQTRAFADYCRLKGLRPLPKPLCDADVSGGRPLAKRPAGSALLAMTTRRSMPVKHIVVFKLDRAFRNASDCLTTVDEWTKLGVTLHIIDMGGSTLDTASAVGRMFLTMLAGFAQFERDMTSERCKATAAVLRSQGKRYCRDAPYGFQIQGDRLIEDAPEQRTIARAVELAGAGLSLRAIATELGERGMFNRVGKVFGAESVRGMVNGSLRR